MRRGELTLMFAGPVRQRKTNFLEHMMTEVLSTPAHKQTDPAKAPGQIVNPIPPSKLYKPAHGGYPGK